MSGLGARLLIWAVLTAPCVFWTTRYGIRISRDLSKSILGVVESPFEDDMGGEAGQKAPTLGIQEIGTVLIQALIACAMFALIVVGILNRTNANTLAEAFLKGATAMGGFRTLLNKKGSQ